MILYTKLQSQEFNLSCTVKTYLYSVCRLLWLEQLRHKKKFVKSDIHLQNLTEPSLELDENMKQITQEFLFQKHYIKLSESCKKVLQLMLNKTSSLKIAQIMGYGSADYANKKKYECKKKLFKMIQQDPLFQKI